MAKALRQPIQVVVYPVRASGTDWEYLLLHCKDAKQNEWQGVIGNVIDREDLLEAATRALTEQASLRPSRLKMVGYSTIFPMEEGWEKDYIPGTDHLVEYVIVAFVDPSQQPQMNPELYDDARWSRIGQARKMLTKHSHYEALLQADDFVRARD